MISDELLKINDLHKSFSTPVLKGINLTFRRGEIHSIVGENGAGKSTLMNILSGQLKMDKGSLTFEGKSYVPANPTEAYETGISSAAQELSIIGTLSVAENILLRKLPHKWTFLSKSKLETTARQFLDLVGLENIHVNTTAEDLTLGETQLLEVAKTLAITTLSGGKLIILDEPTAALSGPQADKLHSIIKNLTVDGITFIYISHRLEDVRLISDTISVMRDGRIVNSAPASTYLIDDMISLMSGKQFEGNLERVNKKVEVGLPLLIIDQITNKYFPRPISFDCHAGEIIGIAGLAGSGRTELLKAVFGLTSIKAGKILRKTEQKYELIENARRAVKLGLGYLSKDRKKSGILSGHSLRLNLTLPGLSFISSRLGIINQKKEREVGEEYISKLAIKCSDQDQSIESLSGGNQQKVLLARWLHCNSEILLLDEPTRGVDVNAKHLIYAQLNELRNQGKVIIASSSEIDELIKISDRILVLSDFKLVKEFKKGEWTENDILATAFQEYTMSKPTVRNQSIIRDGRDHHVSN